MSSDLKKTFLNAWHREHGAHMVEFGGWEMPLNYRPGIVPEHLATRRCAGLFDISHMGRFVLKGKGALPFLQYVLTNNAAALDPGKAQYTMIPTMTGGAVDDAYLYCLDEDEYLLVVNASNTLKDWTWLDGHRSRFSGFSLENRTEQLAMFSLQGPRSKAILETLLEGKESRVPDPGRNNLRRTTVAGTPMVVSRTGYTGEPLGFELFLPAERAVPVWEKILKAGEKEGVMPVGLGARDTLRLEAGLPLYGHELGADKENREIPLMALPHAKIAVSFSEVKGDFIGRSLIKAQFQELKNREEGREWALSEPLLVPFRIWPLALLSEGLVRPPSPVYLDGRPAGYVTSGTMVPYWKFSGKGISSNLTEETGRRAVALAYIDAAVKENQKVLVASRGKSLSAQVVKMNLSAEAPPYARPVFSRDPKKPRPGPGDPLESAAGNFIKKAAANTQRRQKRTINLIPSEQTPSPLVRLLSVTDPADRYAEHRHYDNLDDAEVYYYQGTDFIEEAENRLQEEMARYLGCSVVETRMVSGQMANSVFFSALQDFLNRFDRKCEPLRLRKVFNHHLGRGGHLSSQPMGALREFIALDPRLDRRGAVNFPVLEGNPYQIDLAETEKLLHQHNPVLLILGKSMMIHREPVRELRKMVQNLREKPLIMYDGAHVLGLLGPHFQQPLQEGADVVTGSTHKTFFGTQRGIIGSNFDETTDSYDLWKAVQRRAFPGSVSNHHLGTLVGLLLAACEMNAFAEEYQKQVVQNARAFARALKACGIHVEGDAQAGYTETHQVILRVGYARGPEAARRLEENNIIVNYQALPDDEGFTASSGLRLGVQEMTRFGMKERDFEELAAMMADVILRNRAAAEQVARFRSGFTDIQYCLEKEKARPLVRELFGALFE